MGKTNATYRDHVDAFFDDWQTYRRELRAPNREHWDALADQARLHSMAGHAQIPVEPAMGIVFSVLPAQETRIAALEAQAADGGEHGDE